MSRYLRLLWVLMSTPSSRRGSLVRALRRRLTRFPTAMETSGIALTGINAASVMRQCCACIEALYNVTLAVVERHALIVRRSGVAVEPAQPRGTDAPAMSNIDLFHLFACKTLATLYDHFPMFKGISEEDLAQGADLGGVEAGHAREVAGHTLMWLCDTGYAKAGKSSRPDTR